MPGLTRHGNLQRTARQAVARAYLGQPRTCRANLRFSDLSGLDFVAVLLVEVWASPASSFSRHVALLGGMAIRICLPRYQARLARRGVRLHELPLARGAPLRPPRLRRYRVCTWRLDLRVHAHVAALLAYLTALKPPQWCHGMHLHTSPPCVGFTSITNCNLARESMRDVFKSSLPRLSVARRFCSEWRGLPSLRGCTRTSSHEQPPRASTTNALRCLKRKEKPYGISWPWAINRNLATPSSRSTAKACAFGVKFLGKPLGKEWSFESDHEPLLETLRLFRCPGCPEHAPVIWGEAGDAFAGADATEEYPGGLGAVLAASTCARFGKKSAQRAV